MDAAKEHEDFAVLARYLVPQIMVCKARAIAGGWSSHGSPPTLEEMESVSYRKPMGDGFLLHISPAGTGVTLTLSKQMSNGEKLGHWMLR
jgi:hypothetical protein